MFYNRDKTRVQMFIFFKQYTHLMYERYYITPFFNIQYSSEKSVLGRKDPSSQMFDYNTKQHNELKE